MSKRRFNQMTSFQNRPHSKMYVNNIYLGCVGFEESRAAGALEGRGIFYL